jgi:hypothetical protein
MSASNKQPGLGFPDPRKSVGPVECLGRSFESDQARRAYYSELLAKKLKDPTFRKTPGFPNGSDEDILRLSDPPYFTACPNPFLDEFVMSYGRPYDSAETYKRDPIAVDVSVGKMNQLYQIHTYHTKVPHLAIVPSILHYTMPGDVVLDPFCGTGMTGVALQHCADPPSDLRNDIEADAREGRAPHPVWGQRHAVLSDLGVAPSFIASQYNQPFDIEAFDLAFRQILDEFDSGFGWMYRTFHQDGREGKINYTLWGEVFSCPDCGGRVNYLKEAFSDDYKKIAPKISCPACSSVLKKKELERLYATTLDQMTGESVRTPIREPVLINYRVGKTDYDKVPDDNDLNVIEKCSRWRGDSDVIPTQELPYMHMTHERARLDLAGVRNVHHFFMPRALCAVAELWAASSNQSDPELRNRLLFLFEQTIWTMSVQNLYQPGGFKQVNKYLDGIYYVPAAICEVSPEYAIKSRGERMVRVFNKFASQRNAVAVSTNSATHLHGIPSNTIDYIFTDPPFGENIYYADLNYLVESWHRVTTGAVPEAIIDRAKNKSLSDYQQLMRESFEECARVLKPGRWITIVFSNSKNVVWRAIQEALGTAGFVVADVRTLDKKQGSYRQVTSSAVKQDLVISAYKPSDVLSDQFKLGTAGADSVWSFISEHLRNVPIFVGGSGKADIIAERTPQVLHDRMIAFFVQRSVAVPISGPDFMANLHERFPERDGMYFLAGQVTEYDRKRTTVGELRQLSLFVSDEASAIQWIRQQLHDKPQTFQDLQPQFMKQIQSWAKHEKTIELKEILELNFFCYDGNGPVPSQIHRYLSTNFRAFRNREKDDSDLKAKARDRWYVPDPNKEGDLDKLRLRALLKEYEVYRKSAARKIKEFRTEAVRAGFKHCYDEGDYQTIVDVATKLPEQVIQEDEKLLMYYDVATMRLGY